MKSISTIKRWIKRYSETGDFTDNPRSGRPCIYKDAVKLKTIAFFCHKHAIPGCSSLSLSWTETYFKEHQEILGCSISRSTIHRILNTHSLKPHRNAYFLNITDPDFFQKMEHIISFYHNLPEYAFSFDECSGIQAKAAFYPDLPTRPGNIKKKEFDYKRNGTTDLLAFFNLNDGTVFGDCFDNHKTHTFCSLFLQHVKAFSDDIQLHYIMDNLSTHYHDDFCRQVAYLSNVKYEPLKTGKERREWLGKTDKRIVIHFTPFHGSWLNMIEIWFGILNQRCIKELRPQSVLELQNQIRHFIQSWNTYYAHPFQWNYSGDDLHKKVIKRFITQLMTDNCQMDVGFIAKQLLLMRNIFKKYDSVVQSKEWIALSELFFEKKQFMIDIIEASDKPQISKKALEAFALLSKILNCQYYEQNL